jgi:Domain of unknown function (DUF4111)
VTFAAVLGPRVPLFVTINELTTVAAGYTMAQFTDADAISGGDFALRLAAAMNDNIVDTATGASSQVLLGSPNADQTNSLRSTRSLANPLAACIDSNGVMSSFLALTKPFRGPALDTTLQALANLARNPGQNVKQIYRMTKRSVAFAPALEGRSRSAAPKRHRPAGNRRSVAQRHGARLANARGCRGASEQPPPSRPSGRHRDDRGKSGRRAAAGTLRPPQPRRAPEVAARQPAEPDLLVEPSICGDHGRTLRGARSRQAIGPVPHQWVVRAGDAQLARWQSLTDDAAHAELMVLTACRIWGFAEERTHCSKSEAGLWTLARDPSLQAVRDALRLRAGDQVQLAPAAIGRLLKTVRARIAANEDT